MRKMASMNEMLGLMILYTAVTDWGWGTATRGLGRVEKAAWIIGYGFVLVGMNMIACSIVWIESTNAREPQVCLYAFAHPM